MNAKKMSVEAIKEGIAKEMFYVTGVTKQGEVILVLISNVEKEVIEKGEEALIKYLEYFPDRQEMRQAYLENTSNEVRNQKNNLRVRY